MINNELVRGFDDELNNDCSITLVKIDKIPNCISFELKGQIDTYNSNWFSKKVQMATNCGYRNFIFVCYGISYMSSTGVGAFAGFFKSLGTMNGNIAMIGIQPRVMDVFKILGFEQFFFFGQHREDAISYLDAKLNIKSSIYPKVFSCPICDKKLKAVKAGKYRCPSCKTIIALDLKGQIFIV
jgi:anti-anti-sigma factor